MDAGSARRVAREWIETNLAEWPGLRAAHLVGGITTMRDDAPVPAHKDVDVHLIFDEASPMLRPIGPFMNIVEVSFGGLSIEAGVKSAAEYASADAVLANPEIAHHLTVDSLLHDPSGLLRDLQETVRREYPRRRWVLARLDHERRGLAGALWLRPMVAAHYGASGEVNLLGYSTTFLAAALWVATLNPPRIGGRMFVRLRRLLAEQGRLDLYDELLAFLGIRGMERARVEEVLREGAEAFDLAVRIRRTPHPFQHKLHPHLRPYFVESCRSMIDEGFHRESLAWATAFHCGTTDVILIDGPAEVRPTFAARQDRLLAELGMATPEAVAARFAQANGIYDRFFALAEEIVASHPAIVD